MEKIKVAAKNEIVKGFNVKEGFAILFNASGNPAAITSGWECNDQLYVYRPNQDGTWAGNWEGPETFPVQEVLEAIQEYQERSEKIYESL